MSAKDIQFKSILDPLPRDRYLVVPKIMYERALREARLYRSVRSNTIGGHETFKIIDGRLHFMGMKVYPSAINKWV